MARNSLTVLNDINTSFMKHKKRPMRLGYKIIFAAFFLLALSNQLSAQRVLIDQDSAIQIALKNGLNKGLAEYKTELLNDSIWFINCLICDDDGQRIYDAKAVNAFNGQIIKDGFIAMEEMSVVFGERMERTNIHVDINLDSLPISKMELNQKLTDSCGYVLNPVFSYNDKRIAFQYGFRKIGIVNTDGTNFKQICDECLYPEWLNNDWIMYCKDFEHIYKKNIHSDEEVRITREPYRYDDFQLSPDKKWIAYQSSEMWPSQDSLGNQIFYASMNGQGQNLCVMSMDGKEKKFFKKEWTYYSTPYWTKHSDSIFFYISDQKYVATNLNTHEINYSPYKGLNNMSLSDHQKVIDGTFPFIYHCQVLEIDKNSLKPVKGLIN